MNLPLLIQLTMGNAGIQPLKGTDFFGYFFILSTWPGAGGSGSNT